MEKKLGRRPLPDGERIVQVTINIKKKNLAKVKKEALIIESKYR